MTAPKKSAPNKKPKRARTAAQRAAERAYEARHREKRKLQQWQKHQAHLAEGNYILASPDSGLRLRATPDKRAGCWKTLNTKTLWTTNQIGTPL